MPTLKISRIARKYARAAAEAACAAGVQDRVGDELDSLVRLDPTLLPTLSDRFIPQTRRAALLEEILTQGKVHDLTANTCRLCLENKRIASLPEIAVAFRQEVDRLQGILEVEVTTAAPLSTDQEQRLAATLADRTGQRIRLRPRTDPALLGGLIARVGSLVYDGSVTTQLDNLRKSMVED